MAAVIQISLELAFGELLIKLAVVRRNVSAARFKTKPIQLEKTLKSIEPIFYDSSRLNQVLDHPERCSDKVLKTDNLIEPALRNLINLCPIRKEVGELDGYCDAVYVTHDIVLSEFAIHLSSNEPVAERKRLFIEVHGNKRKRLFIEVHGNKFPTRWIEQIAQLISTQILPMSTDEILVSNWYELIAPTVEVLTLNIHSKKHTLPQFMIERMDLPKVLRITTYNLYPSQLHRCNLRRIKFEHVSVSSFIQPIFVLQNLRTPQFVLSNIGNALISCTAESSPLLLPDLTRPISELKFLRLTSTFRITPIPEKFPCLRSLKILYYGSIEQVWLQFWCQSIEKVNWWMNQHESELYNSKINVVEDDRVESFMENIHEEAPLIGCMVYERHNSQSCGSDFSHDSPPSLCDVALGCASTVSTAIEYNGAQNGTNTYYNTFYANSEEALSIGCVVLERPNSQSCGSDFSSNSLPSYCDVATRCGSTAIKYNGSQNGTNTYYNTFYTNSEEALSIGCVVLERQNSQSCGSDFSCDSLPSYCDVVTRCGSTASAYNGAHKAGPNGAFSRPFSLGVTKLQSTTRRREREGEMGPTATIHKK